jgi:AraC-like DNA-binding protein
VEHQTWGEAHGTTPVPSTAVHRVAGYISMNGHDSMCIGEIAKACGTSVRTLYRNFVREYGTTPMQYLKRWRLDQIRAELLSARPGTTVTQVAFNHGVTHLGRFAREYSSRFGESPSETLRHGMPDRAPRNGRADRRWEMPREARRMMRNVQAAAVALVLVLTGLAEAQVIPKEPVRFKTGESTATVARTIKDEETITFSIMGGAAQKDAPKSGAGFDQTLSLLGISFHVFCPNDSSKPTVTVTPARLEVDNQPMTWEIDGRVTRADAADINADGSPKAMASTLSHFIQILNEPLLAAVLVSTDPKDRTRYAVYVADGELPMGADNYLKAEAAPIRDAYRAMVAAKLAIVGYEKAEAARVASNTWLSAGRRWRSWMP